jgi:hypothetical protein
MSMKNAEYNSRLYRFARFALKLAAFMHRAWRHRDSG